MQHADTPSDEVIAEIIRRLDEQIPFNRLLGISILEIGRDRALMGVEMRDELVGNFTRRSLHGGVIATLLDLVGGLAVLVAIFERAGPDSQAAEAFSNFGTINLHVDYLRPGIGRSFEAAATLLRPGNKVAVARMELRNDRSDLIAVGTGTYSLG